MDYILIPKKAQHIAVPYKCTELYDEDDFMTYPDRKRWTAAQIRGENGYGGRKLEVESFVQTWLYFGCLLEVFKIGGIHVTTEDFVDRERGVVTAKKLPSLFVEWRKRWPKPTPSRKCNCGHYINPFEVKCRAKRCWKTFKHGRFSPEYHSIKSILEEVCQTIGHYCHSEGVAGKPRAIVHVPSPEETPIAPEIVTSIVALGYTLHTAILDIYDIPSHQWRCHWGGTPLLRRLLKTKWCPLQVTSMMTELAIDGHYYLTTIPGPPEAERQTHANCTDEQCVAKGIDEATYVTKHITGKECCDHISVPDELFEIVGRKGAPIVSWVQETDDQKFRLTVTEHNVKNNKTPKYIAISHV
jgi:hypothetical protein